MPQTVPVVLSQDEAARSFDAVTNPKHHTSWSPAYATGVRASEVIGLKVTDIASQRMTLRVEPVEHSNAISRFATSPVRSARSALIPPCGDVCRLVAFGCIRSLSGLGSVGCKLTAAGIFRQLLGP